MSVLRGLSASPEAAWYRVEGGYDGAVERYVVSTAAGRAICNRPEIVGVEYTELLHDAMVAALSTAPFRDLLADAPQEQACVLNFLRGGLNFELRRALSGAYGFNRHTSAFLSSQRSNSGGTWHVREDSYRKLDIPAQAALVVGDVVATGVTLSHGFETVAEHLRRNDLAPRGLVLFTIGGPRAEEVLDHWHSITGGRVIVVYLEARFALVGEDCPMRIGIAGTDLVRRDAQSAPEFVESQYESVAYPLERCAIYDAGSRAFDTGTYLADVIEYWEEMAALAAGGWTTQEALTDRWPEAPRPFEAVPDLATLCAQRLEALRC